MWKAGNQKMLCNSADLQHCGHGIQGFTQLRSAPLYETVVQINRRLLGWSDNEAYVDWLYVVICLLLTCMAGLMSGLTLGLLSLDTVDLEVLLRSGTAREKRCARKIMPIISNNHLLLVTLLMCNAVAMEALPLFLDKLADPVTAVIVSVTAVLFFGEIIPQSVCSRYGLAIGASLAPLVRLLMWVCSPVAWPMGKLLDLLIGPDHHTLFRRRQLKELVSMHAEDAGMGGALGRDEIKVITGALDLTSKVAFRAMTPLDKVFMLSHVDLLDEVTLRSILRSGHSRIPVHRAGDRREVVGLVLVKELLQYRLGSSTDVPVAMLRIRSIPRLPATTRMYDMLRLFQTGRSHMAVLTQPPRGELQRLLQLDPSLGKGDVDGFLPYSLYDTAGGNIENSYPPSALDTQESFDFGVGAVPYDAPTASFRHWGTPLETPRGEYDEANSSNRMASPASTTGEAAELSPQQPRQPQPSQRMNSLFAAAPAAAVIVAEAAEAEASARTLEAATLTGGTTPGACAATVSSAAVACWPSDSGRLPADHKGTASCDAGGGERQCTTGRDGADADAEYDMDEVEEGRPIGIITIEDVIEELIRAEIVDETDRYIDNNRLIRANQAQLAQSLPEHLAKVPHLLKPNYPNREKYDNTSITTTNTNGNGTSCLL
ncbi:hypothetical protein VOLCADRAFT_103216 [Volvox carteri f. nagariensis]|uniref:CNNM transmembrane domain-containing protein n=1 Tax=Volvox carteri f. nagariensis TaxID=3068 RepID=D8TK81_VOLCA|nr:uncharacterized protein VOLCADRAFT_103216 [Volvox carteri f. nagariensis]EFJ52015.1 hypothetical protein VOLCADRAFT_103216 [Volvox carteri f. nagariensis]|eukprot:XP_002946789.1 hypothetical protein VOLCADRAFT_103216 [Volvox carteri f. nagariensis]